MRGGFFINDTIISFLNISPIDIQNIHTYVENDTLHALITLRCKDHVCPICGSITRSIKDYKPKRIVHSVLNQRKCIIIHNVRRYKCLCCPSSFVENDPFSNPHDKISKLTIINILNDLKIPANTFKEVAARNGVSDTTAMSIFDTYVNIERKTLPKVLCIDEVYAIKSPRSKYVCVLMDFETSSIIDLLPSRQKYQLQNYLQKVSDMEKQRVEFVSIDMWDTYRTIAKQNFKNALICVDSFHVMKLINDSLNTIRLRVMSRYEKKDNEYYLLKKFAWLLLKNESDLSYSRRLNRRLNRYMSYREILNEIKSIDITLLKAWELKEQYQHLNQTSTEETIELNLNIFLDHVAKANINEFNSIAGTLKNWRIEIMNSFKRIGTRRISNGPIESINGQIKKIKKCGNGYTNFARFRNKAIYSINKHEHFDLSGTDVVIKEKGKPRGKYKKLGLNKGQ